MLRPVLSPLPVLAATLLLAGCVNVAPAVDPSPDAEGRALPALPAGATPFTTLVCAGDALVDLTVDRTAKDCNYQATHDSGPAAEVHLAVNPTNPLNLVGGSKDFTLGEDPRCGKYNVWSGVYVTFDGGRTWNHSLLPGYPGDTRETALSEYACGSDPVIVYGPDGTVYYVSIHVTIDATEESVAPPQLSPYLGYPIENAGLAVTRSLDGGRTWEDPVVVFHRDDGSLPDKEWAAVDPVTGDLYVTYIDTRGGGLHVVRSSDQGASWMNPMLIEAGGNAHQFGQVVVDPAGVVHYTYWSEDQEGGVESIFHRSSDDRGETWSERHKVAAFTPIMDLEFTHKYRIVPNPALAVDANDGTLYVAYPFPVAPENPGVPGGHTDALVARSTDGGLTWQVTRVSDDEAAPLNGQWMQAVAVGPDGTVHTTWLDYRDDPSGQSALVYYAHSTDGGATWSKNVPVSDVPFDGTGGYHQSGAGTIGDYMGLAVSPLAVHPFWADTRHERNDVFSAVIL